MYSGSAYAAEGDASTQAAAAKTADAITNDNILEKNNNSTKLVIGGKDSISGEGKDSTGINIQTDGSVGYLIEDIKNNPSLSGILGALSQNTAHPGSVVVTGAVGGEGQLDEGIMGILAIAGSKVDDKLGQGTTEKIIKVNTVGTDKEISKTGNIDNIIGGQTINGKEVQPVIIGFVGSDLSINTNATVISDSEPSVATDQISIIRNGDVTTNINSGNVLGGFGGSASIAVGNINADYSNTITIIGKPIMIMVTAETNGNDKTVINGDVTTKVNSSANLAGFAAGSGAIAMGGTSTSEITGSTNLVIDSNGSHRNLEGITTTLAGGGAAVTTLGGTATSTVGGSTNISITNGLSALVAGGGVAISGDAAGMLDKGNDNGTSDVTSGSITVKINDAIQGGTATAEVKKDSNISITGTSAAAGIVGGGVAASYHSYENRDTTDGDANNAGTPGGSSTATSTVGGKTTININVESGDDLEKVVANIKDNIDKANINGTTGTVNKLAAAANAIGAQPVVTGVVGGGLAAAVGDANSKAEVSSQDVEINLQKGYVVGTFAGGAAAAVHDKSTVRNTENGNVLSATATINNGTINVTKDTKAIGVFGNGLALSMEYNGNKGDNNASGNKPTVKQSNVDVSAENTTINVEGKADGVYGSGMIIANGAYHGEAVKMSTESNTINLNNATVSGLQFEQLNNVIEMFAGEGAKPLGEKLPAFIADLNRVASDVAVAGGGITVGQGGYNHKVESVVNVDGNTVIDGNLIAGGVSSAPNTGNMPADDDKKTSTGTRVDKSVINLNGGIVTGGVYAGGVSDNASAEDIGDGTGNNGYRQGAALSTVGTSVVNLNGTTVEGEISGRGYQYGVDYKTEEDKNKVAALADSVENSTLNITGHNILSPLAADYTAKSGNKSKINNFDAINVDANSVTVLKGLEAGNIVALIDANGKTINVKPGASLDISALTAGENNKYFVVNNYNKDNSTLWNKDKFVYDRTQYFADTAITETEGNPAETDYSITYKTIDQLTDGEKDAAAESFMNRLGNDKLRNAFYQYYHNQAGVKSANPGFDALLSDLSQVGDQAAAGVALGNSAMVGEVSGATNTSATFAGDMADTAALRLSFTQDRVTGDEKIDEDGNIWAKYLHNKFKGEGLASSFGDMHFDASYDGIMVGSDFAKKGKVQSGIAFAYADGDSSGIGGEDDFDLWGLTFYGNVKNDDTNIIADIGYSRGDHETSAYVLDKKMTADRDISVFSLGVRAEKLITKGSLQIVPYTGLRYLNVDPSTYTAYYNGKKAFDIDPDRQNIFTLPVGVSLRNEHVTKNGWTITPQFDLSYVWAFGDTDNDMTVNMAGAPDQLSYTVMDSGSWLTSLALEAGKGDWTYGLGYSWQKGSDARSDKWFVNAEYKF